MEVHKHTAVKISMQLDPSILQQHMAKKVCHTALRALRPSTGCPMGRPGPLQGPAYGGKGHTSSLYHIYTSSTTSERFPLHPSTRFPSWNVAVPGLRTERPLASLVPHGVGRRG